MWTEEAMPQDPARVLHRDLFLGEAQAYRDALSRYDALRSILKRERTLAQPSRITGLSSWRLWPDLRRFRRAGMLGLLDRRTRPPPRGRPPSAARLPEYIQHHMVRLAMAQPFTARELARIVRECDHQPSDDRGIQRVLAQHRRSPAALQRHHQGAQQASLPTPLPTQPLTRPLAPHTRAQRLALAWGPEPLRLRFRADDEYPTEEQARGRILEWLEVGFRPRRVAKLLAIQPPVVSQRWGAPEAIVSDHGSVLTALQPCLDHLALQWAPIVKGHPWHNLAESGCAVQRRMLDADVL
jgi:hypothetical protein